MSTRCNVIVKEKGKKVILYHHHDGYLEGVGVDLYNRFSKKFNDKDSYVYWEDVVNELVKDANDEYEVTSCIHGDIEYLYTIDTKKKTITMNPIDNDWSAGTATKGKSVNVLKKLNKKD